MSSTSMRLRQSPRLDIRGVTKRYGPTVAVDDLTVSVPAGQVTGFVGPNGAGKSTLMRIVLGLARPQAGTALVNGQAYVSLRHPLREVGALLDAGATHPARRAVDHLRWMAVSNGLARRRVDEVLDLVGLTTVARKRTGGFSLGMAQRLGIAAALLGDPPILLLDEPVNGLDPEGVRWIRSLLRSLAAEGRIVFVSSHLMSELEDTADHLVVIGRGRLLADVGVAELLAAASDRSVTLHTPDSSRALAVLANAGATVSSTDHGAITVTGLDGERIARLMAESGLRLAAMAPHQASLEDAYMQLTEGSVDYAARSQEHAR